MWSLGFLDISVIWKLVVKRFGCVVLKAETVMSERMKVGFVGLRIAHMRRIVSKTKKRNTMIPQNILWKSILFLPLW